MLPPIAPFLSPKAVFREKLMAERRAASAARPDAARHAARLFMEHIPVAAGDIEARLGCPPILPVMDTRVLAEHVDQIAFVMTSRRTPKALARRALAALGVNQRKVVGVVLNEVDDADLGDIARYARAYASPRLAA